MARAARYLQQELDEVDIDSEISGRAKHFYSIYVKMTRKGREFNEIYDLTAMRVLVDSVKDCYGTIGVDPLALEAAPGPLQGLGRDAQVQHVPGAPHHGDRARGAAAGDPDPNPARCTRPPSSGSRPTGSTRTPPAAPRGKVEWLKQMVDFQGDLKDPQQFVEGLKVDLFEDEVFVFTPRGEVKSLAAGATPLDFAYEVHTDVGHRCVGAKVNGKIVPLHYELKSGDICEVLTSKKERGPSRDWLALAKTTRAQSKIRAWFQRERREDSERAGRELLPRDAQAPGAAAAAHHRIAAARRRDPRDGLPQGRRVLHRARPVQDLGPRRHQQGACSGSRRASRSRSREWPTT